MTLFQAILKNKGPFGRWLQKRKRQRSYSAHPVGVTWRSLFGVALRVPAKTGNEAIARLWFYRVSLPLRLSRLSAEQKWICRAFDVSERAYRIRAFEGVQLSKWTLHDKSNPGIDLEALMKHRKELFAEDLARMIGRA